MPLREFFHAFFYISLKNSKFSVALPELFPYNRGNQGR